MVRKEVMAECETHPSLQIHRHWTAMKRLSLSRPIRIALSDRLISPSVDFLDYGCGLGDDVDLLQPLGVSAVGRIRFTDLQALT
jgi:hypothetical protein